jgi:hypothetical protein
MVKKISDMSMREGGDEKVFGIHPTPKRFNFNRIVGSFLGYF